MSKHDWITGAITLVVAGASYFIAGPWLALASIGCGVIILFVVHLRGNEKSSEPIMSDALGLTAMDMAAQANIEIRFNSNDSPYRSMGSHDAVCYRFGLYVDGPTAADNVQVRLVEITPRPKNFRNADFPYAISPLQASGRGRINPRTESYYEFLGWWVSAPPNNQFIVSGIDTKAERPSNGWFEMVIGEHWRMDYEITLANGGPKRVSFDVECQSVGISIRRN